MVEIRKRTIFDSKKYPTVMYFSILIMCLFITFSFINLLENPKINNQQTTITGLATQEQNQSQTSIPGANLYSNKAYLVYYSITIGLIILISTILILLISKLKENLKNKAQKSEAKIEDEK